MNTAEVRELMKPLTVGTGSGIPKPNPDSARNNIAFWNDNGTPPRTPDSFDDQRKLQMIRAYVQIVIRTGSQWRGEGIRLLDGNFEICDKAVVKSALANGILEYDNIGGIFRLTEVGWTRLFG